MHPIRWSTALIGLVVMIAAVGTGCSRHYVVVTPPEDGYSRRDTLYGRLHGDEIRVTFRFDTIFRTDTVTRLDTLWEEGARVDTVVRIDSVLRVDTLRVARTDTVVRTDTITRADTVRTIDDMVRPPTVLVDTVIRADTVLRVDTVRVAVTDTVVRADTTVQRDTVEIAVADTIVRVDTVRVAGKRLLFLPPGHYPPEGRCRVWIHGLPPGQQARAAPCDQLEDVPAGAFILFGGEAWDADWDWVAEARENGGVPPEIVAVTRRGRRGG